MKRILIAAVGVLGLAAAGCQHSNVAKAPATSVASTAAGNCGPVPAQAFQPYNLINQPAPKPATAPQPSHRYLHIANYQGQPYLTDPDGRHYHIGRDAHGDIYPAYYDAATNEDYPLYYDNSRDRYYRVCQRDNGYYANYVGDPDNEYYQCDQPYNYNYYAPPQYDAPVIYDGSQRFCYYNEPAYYREPDRYEDHWHSDNWIAAVPIMAGFYFVLGQSHDSGPGWYYGYHGGDYHDRYAYRQSDPSVQVNLFFGGQRSSGYYTAMPPRQTWVPREQWGHYNQVAYNRPAPSQPWGYRGPRTGGTNVNIALNFGGNNSNNRGGNNGSFNGGGGSFNHGGNGGYQPGNNGQRPFQLGSHGPILNLAANNHQGQPGYNGQTHPFQVGSHGPILNMANNQQTHQGYARGHSGSAGSFAHTMIAGAAVHHAFAGRPVNAAVASNRQNANAGFAARRAGGNAAFIANRNRTTSAFASHRQVASGGFAAHRAATPDAHRTFAARPQSGVFTVASHHVAAATLHRNYTHNQQAFRPRENGNGFNGASRPAFNNNRQFHMAAPAAHFGGGGDHSGGSAPRAFAGVGSHPINSSQGGGNRGGGGHDDHRH